MPLVWAAVRWFGVVALGWLGSDIFNENQTKDQITAATIGNSAKNSFKNRGWLYAVAFIVILVLFFVLKKFKFIKK